MHDPVQTKTGSYHSVIIVGAGIAGLTAAKRLISVFPDLLVVEAGANRGGRIKQVLVINVAITGISGVP